jgi:hypothetical protein
MSINVLRVGWIQVYFGYDLLGAAGIPDGALMKSSTRIDWAELLKRVHDVDALVCQCGGRLNFIALILDDEPASATLDSLHLSASPSHRSREIA